MGKRLNEQISSAYIHAANKLNGQKCRKRIVVYVESYDDIFFWRMVLSKYEDDKRYFEVMLPSREKTLERGKKSVLMNIISRCAGESMIACVDADYDYLLQGATGVSEVVCYNPYVLHTYAYAIENLQCYAESLHDVCVAVTLNDHQVFDFPTFLHTYSQIIFPLFVWSVWAYRTDRFKQFSLTEFNTTIELSNFSIAYPNNSLEKLRHKVQQKIAFLQRNHPNAKESYLNTKHDLINLGVEPVDTYLYIQGHHLFDKVVVPIMKRLCDQLIREREREINQTAIHDTQRRNELSSYSHSVEDVIPMLRRNVGYLLAKPYLRLNSDVEKLLLRVD